MRASAVVILALALWLPSPVLGDDLKISIPRSADRAIQYLQTDSAAWLSKRCAACHHAAMPLWALSEAEKRGYTIDKHFLAGSIETALGSREKMIAAGLLPNPEAPRDPRPLAKGVNMGQIFMAVAAESFEHLNDRERQNVTWITSEAVRKQRDDGSWQFFLSRPPINENQSTDNAWIIMALQGEKDPVARQSQHAALEKASRWLSVRDADDNPQVKRLKLLIALRSHEPREQIQAGLDELLKIQNPDGGWPQLSQSNSDAFATGQSLYVLGLAGYTLDNPQIRRGVDFLLDRQLPDGSWPMTSRASPDGRPGSAKLLTPIISAATSWSVLGLTSLCPRAVPH
jgi:prenyltransferase/squalene oxidase-like repeat protein